MVITIPEKVEEALRIPVKGRERELKKLLALKLYEKGIPINFDREELTEDLKTIDNRHLRGGILSLGT